MYSEYYTAQAVKKWVWFVVGAMKNESNWAFVRTLDDTNDVLEFFVSPDFEEEFLHIMGLFKDDGVILNFEKKPNRLKSA